MRPISSHEEKGKHSRDQTAEMTTWPHFNLHFQFRSKIEEFCVLAWKVTELFCSFLIYLLIISRKYKRKYHVFRLP